jgi:hypothetical protein
MYVLYQVESKPDCNWNPTTHLFTLVGICKSVKHAKKLVQKYADDVTNYKIVNANETRCVL